MDEQNRLIITEQEPTPAIDSQEMVISTSLDESGRTQSGLIGKNQPASVCLYPNDQLRVKTEPVVNFDQELTNLIELMANTLYTNKAIGLAANQIGVNKSVFLIDCVVRGKTDLRIFVNPQITKMEGEVKEIEGCLSFPGCTTLVKRARAVEGKAQDQSGKEFKFAFDGSVAIAVQHECDHLNGILMIDHISSLCKRFLKKKLAKVKKRIIQTHFLP